ncbi:MAG TPA: hypothetical protein VF744_00540 [Beijerinckiaceae bacterium]
MTRSFRRLILFPMQARRHRWSRAALAVVAAYALALQALLAAAAAGAAHLSGRHGDAGWLCAPQETGAPAPGAPVVPHEDCCLLACHAAPLGNAATPVAAAPARMALGAGLLPARAAFAIAPASFLPLGSRAPPLLG